MLSNNFNSFEVFASSNKHVPEMRQRERKITSFIEASTTVAMLTLALLWSRKFNAKN